MNQQSETQPKIDTQPNLTSINMIESFTPQTDQQNKENQLQNNYKFKRERNVVTDKDENEK